MRAFRFDQVAEAESFAEEGGIAVLEVQLGYRVLARRRLLEAWAAAHGRKLGWSELPTVTGVYGLFCVGEQARQLEAELGIDVMRAIDGID